MIRFYGWLAKFRVVIVMESIAQRDETSGMSEEDVSEELPNDDDSVFVSEGHGARQHAADTHSQQQDSNDSVDSMTAQNAITHDQVYVATSQGILTAEQLQEADIRTTHIVIHDQSLNVADGESELKSPNTPLPPPTPASPLSREKGFKYQWDQSVFLPVLPIRCKSSNGELHKARFGSGGRGRCIKMGDKWYTPSEFEAVCGRSNSKDWKRSVRYGGRTLQCLIEDSILHPHATSCTCAACCDDEAVTGPVRLFVPYKRRKRDNNGETVIRKKLITTRPNTPASSSPNKDTAVVVSLTPGSMMQPLRVNSTETGEMIQIISADPSGNITVGEPTMMMTQIAHPVTTATIAATAIAAAPMCKSESASTATIIPPLDVNEQKMWWQLEEMSINLSQQCQQLKSLLEEAKQQSITAKENAINVLRAQLDKEKHEALNALRIEAQMNLSRILMEERVQKDIAVQQVLAQVRAELNSGGVKCDTVQSAVDKVTYSVTWVPHTVSQNQIEAIIADAGCESDKEK